VFRVRPEVLLYVFILPTATSSTTLGLSRRFHTFTHTLTHTHTLSHSHSHTGNCGGAAAMEIGKLREGFSSNPLVRAHTLDARRHQLVLKPTPAPSASASTSSSTLIDCQTRVTQVQVLYGSHRSKSSAHFTPAAVLRRRTLRYSFGYAELVRAKAKARIYRARGSARRFARSAPRAVHMHRSECRTRGSRRIRSPSRSPSRRFRHPLTRTTIDLM
jgi:hypothetical protein